MKKNNSIRIRTYSIANVALMRCNVTQYNIHCFYCHFSVLNNNFFSSSHLRFNYVHAYMISYNKIISQFNSCLSLFQALHLIWFWLRFGLISRCFVCVVFFLFLLNTANHLIIKSNGIRFTIIVSAINNKFNNWYYCTIIHFGTVAI